MSYRAAFLCDGHYKQVVTLMVVLCTLPDVAIIPQFDARATIDSHKAEIEEAPIGDPEEPLGLAAIDDGQGEGVTHNGDGPINHLLGGASDVWTHSQSDHITSPCGDGGSELGASHGATYPPSCLHTFSKTGGHPSVKLNGLVGCRIVRKHEWQS